MKLTVRIIMLVVAVGLLAGGWDFLSFVGRAEKSMTQGEYPDAQAVAALTGASDQRIIEAVRLSKSRHLPLVISGVHVSTTYADIARIAGVEETDIACCVTLGYGAASTAGNGDEIAEWARRFKLRRIIVVTSEYHMDRAMLELRRAMPEATFYPFAVNSMHTRPAQWYRDPDTASRMVQEWLKYRLAELRIRVVGSMKQDARNARGGAKREHA